MQIPSHVFRCLFASATLASTAAAQIISTQVFPTTAQGQMHGWAVGIQIEDPAYPTTPHELLVWGGGTSMTAPERWTENRFGAVSYNHPDFSHAALSAWSTSRNVPPAVYRSMSTGGDICPPVSSSGALQMAGAWYALSFTVASAAAGLDGSLVHQRSIAGNHAAEVFTYYAELGQGFHPQINDSVFLEYSDTQLGLNPWPIGPISEPEINALDWGMGAISVDPNRLGGRFFPIRNRFYFTLSKAWLAIFGAQLQALPPPLSLTLDPASIYCLTWEPNSSTPSGYGWSDPVEVFSRSTLFPGTTLPIEIDALSVFEGLHQNPSNPPNMPLRVVLSLTPESDFALPQPGAYSQVLVFQPYFPYVTPGVQPLRTQTGAFMTAKMGLTPRIGEEGEPDDVTGTCGVDPDEIMLACGVAARSIYPAAVPREGLGNLGLSGYRSLFIDDHGEFLNRFYLTATGTSIGAYPFGIVRFFLESPTSSTQLDAQLIVPGQLTCTLELPGDLGSLGDINVRAQLYGLSLGSPITEVALRNSWHVTLKY